MKASAQTNGDKEELISSSCSTYVTSVVWQKNDGKTLTTQLTMSANTCHSEDESVGLAIKYGREKNPGYSAIDTVTLLIP